MRRLLPWTAPLVAAWASRHERRLCRDGRVLSDAERQVALSVGVLRPERVRVLEVDHIVLPAAGVLTRLAGIVGLPAPHALTGITLGYGIYLRRAGTLSHHLLAHECRHVHQHELAGSLRKFISLYLRQVARHGYRSAPFEVDARQAATQSFARRADGG
jgi:hypothetical protein